MKKRMADTNMKQKNSKKTPAAIYKGSIPLVAPLSFITPREFPAEGTIVHLFYIISPPQFLFKRCFPKDRGCFE